MYGTLHKQKTRSRICLYHLVGEGSGSLVKEKSENIRNHLYRREYESRDFRPISRFISETTEDMGHGKTNRNSYAIYRMMPFPTTSSDPRFSDKSKLESGRPTYNGRLMRSGLRVNYG